MLVSKINGLFRRIKTSNLLFFEEQFMYGHREVLLHYCSQRNPDLDKSLILEGSIDHGFVYHENIWRLRKRNLMRAKRYVWNDRQVIGHGQSSSVVATGAPWLYLLNDLGLTPLNIITKLEKNPKKIIIFPGHNVGVHAKYNIKETLETYMFAIPLGSQVTVCLFWMDFCDPETRRGISELGWQVETVGYVPRLPVPDSTQGGRQNFLLELFNLFSDANLILTDNLSTGLFYALSLNVQVMYIPTKQMVEYETEVNGIMGITGIRSKGFFNSEKLWIQEYFPEILKTKAEPNKFLEFAWNQLGYKNFLENESGIKFKWIKSEPDQKALDLYRRRLNSIKEKFSL